ncbi:hypothetical protein [Thermococcus thermotolerans]|uniref:hypothetical protein n=1 Tax=Thermococcus thermotolerans TaxID=2969672 RepID=UPI00215802B1|nr:hypothetical protein [Thermococcus thermotolerans]
MRFKKMLIVTLIVLVFAFIFPRGLIVSTDAREIPSESNPPKEACPFTIRTSYIFENFTYFFEVITNNTTLFNISLKGIGKGQICTPEGILLYAYFTEDSRSSLVFLDYNLSERWRREFPAYPLKYTKDGLILVSNPTFGSSGSSCVYVMNITTGRLLNWLCPDVLGGHVSDVRITGERMYVTIGEPRRPPLETYALIYMKAGEKVQKAEITSIPGEGVGIRLLIDANEKYAAVAYFLANERGEEKNGICVFRVENLKKIACKEFDEGENPEKVKLEGNIVYVQTPWEVKAYRIFSLW